MSLDLRRVLSAYPPWAENAQWAALGSAGGFSGSRVWRGLTADGSELCLKAHPPAADADRLEWTIHRWMVAGRVARLAFVPQLFSTREGRTVVRVAGRAWEVTEWIPGDADFHANPTDARLAAAVEAVARLHDVWSRSTPVRSEPCPAVERRWNALEEWSRLIASGWRPRPTTDDPVGSHAEAAWSRLPGLVSRSVAELGLWRNVRVPVQACLCDVWHDHVLFAGDRVSGLIDYAGAKVDHVAVDLARLLGSLVPDEPYRVARALRAYTNVRPLPNPELVKLLDRTGVVVGLTNWLRWLYRDGRCYPDRTAVARRIAELVRRLG